LIEGASRNSNTRHISDGINAVIMPSKNIFTLFISSSARDFSMGNGIVAKSTVGRIVHSSVGLENDFLQIAALLKLQIDPKISALFIAFRLNASCFA